MKVKIEQSMREELRCLEYQLANMRAVHENLLANAPPAS